MIKPVKKDQELAFEIQSKTGKPGLHIWWLGQSGFLIKYLGQSILFDPYLSDSLTIKYQNTSKPHERISELVIDPALLVDLDVVTSSHNHTDHLDSETLRPILLNNKDIKFIIPEANRQFVCERVGCEADFPIGLNFGETVEIKNITIKGYKAAHNEVEFDENGNSKFMGYVVEMGPFKIYHSGDTLLYEGLIDSLKKDQIDVAFLPINGHKPERGVAGNLNAQEAALVAYEAKIDLVIPHHYDMFAFNTADPEDFVQECKKLDVRHEVMNLGGYYHYKKKEL